MIEKTIEELKSKFGAAVISGDVYASMPHDIDILIEPKYAVPVQEILLRQGFTITSLEKRKVQAQRFEDGKSFFLDIAYSLDYLEVLFFKNSFKESLWHLVREDYNLEKFIRALYLLRGDQKNISFVRTHFLTYQQILFDTRYIRKPIFRTALDINLAIGIMKKEPLALVCGLSFPAFITCIVKYLLLRFKRIGSGSVIAVVGPDGSGKTTIIEKLIQAMPATRRMYMGDWGFVLQPFYNRMHDQHIYIARLSYPFFFVENWIRYIRAWYLKMCGVTVLVDRYPGLNRHLRKSDIWLRLNDMMYACFPRADRYIFISLDPEEIHRRKPELSIAEIAESQKNMRQRLKNQNHVEIENVNLDSCLNDALRYIYKS